MKREHSLPSPSHHMIVERADWSAILQARREGVSWNNLRTRYGMSAVGMAIFEESAVAVRMLLELGCPLDSEKLLDGSVFSPLWSALEKGLPTIMDLLLQAGADPNEAHPDYISPVYYASKKGLLEETLVLCKHGCVPNVDLTPSPLKMWIDHLAPYKDEHTSQWKIPSTEPIVALLNRGAIISENSEGVDEIQHARHLWFQNPLDNASQAQADLTLSWMQHNLLRNITSVVTESVPTQSVRKM